MTLLVADNAYRAAAAQLLGSFVLADGPAGAVVVVRGSRWAEQALDAMEAGATGIVVTRLRGVDLELVSELVDRAEACPVVIERRGLDHDRAGALPAVTAVAVECAAPVEDLQDVVRDALGWTEHLVPGGVVVRKSGGGRRMQPSVALLEPVHGGPPVSIVAASSDRSAGHFFRVVGAGPERTEIVGDATRTRVMITVTDSAGCRVLPTGWETSERRALRKMKDALDAPPDAPSDLVALARDEALARAVLHR